jgi:hypothetical protein
VYELKTFISRYDIDVMLISETHFTEKAISNYATTVYHTSHPAGIARGGSAILLKNLHSAPPLIWLLL